MPNMGLFFISPYKTERLIDRMLQSMHNRESGKDPEGMTKEDVKEKLKKYWPYHESARKHYIRSGKRYRAKIKRQLLREAGNSEQLQSLHEGGETERPAGA